MKAVQKMMFFKARSFLSPPFKPNRCHHQLFCSAVVIKQQDLPSNPEPNPTDATVLTKEEITQINLLIPRLCTSTHFKEATNLITAALHTNPPLESIPIPILLQSLTTEPDLTQAMYLLNQIKFSPKIVSFLKPITKMLVSSYFGKGLPRQALKIFQWVSRSDFPKGCVDSECYDVLVNGFWRYGMILEALRVLRVMVNENMEIKDSVRIWVYRGLLREARVKEAMELKKGLDEYSSLEENQPSFRSIECFDASCSCTLHCSSMLANCVIILLYENSNTDHSSGTDLFGIKLAYTRIVAASSCIVCLRDRNFMNILIDQVHNRINSY